MTSPAPKRTSPPPDPHPRAPTFRLPPNSCDAHCHVFGPKHVFPYHPTSTYEPPDAGKERLKQLHDALGLQRAVIVQASCHGPDNRAMLDAIATSGGAYRGVCLAYDTTTDAEFAHLHAGGVRGVRFNFVAHLGGAPDLSTVRRILDRVRPLGWHVVLHTEAEDIVRYEEFFASIDLPVVFDHFARVPADSGVTHPSFAALTRLMRRETVWCKISGADRISAGGPPFYDAVPFARALLALAPERILWGTDFPHPNQRRWMPNDGDLLNLLPLFTDNDGDLLARVLVRNPARLYGFTE